MVVVGRRFYTKRIPYQKIALQKWAKQQDSELRRKQKELGKEAEEEESEEDDNSEVEEGIEEKEFNTADSEGSEISEVEIEDLKKEKYRLIKMVQVTKRIVRYPKLKKSLSPSSKRWLQRQFRDPFVIKAQIDEYRCRSAYKLLEIHEKYRLFKPGQTVVDLGCCPGSWTQVAVKATRALYEKYGSFVLGMDIQETKPIEGATIISKLDFLQPSSQNIIKKVLKNRQADVLISDMAPSTTGIRFSDHLKVSELCYSTLNFVPRVCRVGASLVMKAFDGAECKNMIKDLRFLFEKGLVVHPKATRQPSSEFFYVGFKYRGNKLLPRIESEPETRLLGPPHLVPRLTYYESPYDVDDA